MLRRVSVPCRSQGEREGAENDQGTRAARAQGWLDVHRGNDMPTTTNRPRARR
jgi:hypothetical protein